MKLSVKKNGEKPVNNAPSKRHFKKLTHYIGFALCLLLLVILTGAWALEQFSVSAAEKKQADASQKQIVFLVASRVSQRIDFVSRTVQKWAKRIDLKELKDSPVLLKQNEDSLSSLFPFVDRVVLKPIGAYRSGTRKNGGVSFASLDLVREIEQGKKAYPELFLSGKFWKIQIAMPVYNLLSTNSVKIAPEGKKKVAGVLLVIFNSNLLKDVLNFPDGRTTGAISLLQRVGREENTILTKGHGTGYLTEVGTKIPGWRVSYQTQNNIIPLLVNRARFWIILLISALLSVIVVTVPFFLLRRRVHAESIKEVRFLQSLIRGEKKSLPDVKLDFFFTMATILKSIMTNARKDQNSPASSPGKPAVSMQSTSSSESKDTLQDDVPLFKEDDILDVDIFEEDEDLLGLNLPGEGGNAGNTMNLNTEDDFLNTEDDMLQELDRVDVPKSIFRAYDIRGIVGETLTEIVVEQIGLALGTEALSRNQFTLCVGYDGRNSSPVLAKALISGINQTGCDVIDIGRVPTPVLYFAGHHLKTNSGVMITGSHNPANYNGFKMVLDGETLANETIQKLYQRIDNQNYVSGQGKVSEQSVSQAYLDTILNDIAVAAPLKVVVDAGNGIAGELGPQLIEELGCEVIPLFCDVDGTFPNHHPDPGKPENLRDLIKKVEEEDADIGIAFDGDGDRLGVVTNKGKIIYPDRLLMLFAKDVVSRNPGADVIFDVKCSRRLNGLISSYGGRPIMWKTGHSLIKAKMKETGALLAGEMSGHVFFKERWFGFDDGIYSAARLLEILGIDERSSDLVFQSFPEDVSTPEINIEVTDENKFELIKQLKQQGEFDEGSISNIDGVRVDYADGWGLCRASNTTPVLVLRFEADDDIALERIKGVFRAQLLRVDSSLSLTF